LRGELALPQFLRQFLGESLDLYLPN